MSSELRLQHALLDAVETPLFLLDLNGRIEFANRASLRALHQMPEACTGKLLWQIVPDPAEREHIRGFFDEPMPHFPHQFTFHLTDRMIWRVRDLDGHLMLTGIPHTDLASRHSTDTLRAVARHFPNGDLFVFDHDLRYIVADGALLKQTPYSRESLEGRRVDEVLDGPELDFLESLFRRTLEGEQLTDVIRYQNFVFEYRTAPIKNGRDEITAGIVITQDVTQHHALEDRLREERNRAQKFLDSASTILVSLDNTGHVALINRHGCEVLGYDNPRELIGQDWFSNCLPDDQREAARTVFAALMRGEIQPNHYAERVVLKRDGTRITVGWHNTVVTRNGAGEIIGTLSAGQDISEQKAAIGQLADSEWHFRQLFENTQAVMLVIEPRTGEVFAANPAAQRFYGYDDLVGMRVRDITPLPPAEINQIVGRAKNGASTSFRLRHTLANGDVRDVQVFSSPIDVDGQTLRHLTVFDVTDQVIAENRLRDSEANLRAILDSTQTAFTLIDTNFRVQANNQLSRDLSQLATGKDQQPGEDAREYVRPEDMAGFIANYRATLRGATMVTELDVGERNIEVRYYPVTDADDAVIGVCMAVTDITDRKQAESQRLALLVADQRAEILSRFITDASHEFRTPLAVISTSVNLLQRYIRNDANQEAVARHLHKVLDSAQGIARLVDDLELMTLLDTGAAFDLSTFRLDYLVKVAVEEAGPVIADHGLRLDLKLEQSGTLHGDVDLLAVALGHLLHNAARFTPSGGAISVRTRSGMEHTLEIHVQDSGPGIQPEHLPHIFERFFRTDDAHTTRGFGLGLPIAKAIIEGHSGALHIDSEPGVGTTARVTLPAARPG